MTNFATMSDSQSFTTTDAPFRFAAGQSVEVGMISGFLIIFIVGVTLFRIWLARRQIRHVTGHRDTVPAAFTDKVSLSDHRKAADYTCAKVGLSVIDSVVSVLLLLGLTVGGGIDWLADSWARLWAPTLFFQTIALFGSVFLITMFVSAILDFYRVFRLESRFGFNRTSRRLWMTDQVRGALLSLLIELPLVLVAVWLMEFASTSWWFWLWAVLVFFNLMMAAIYPRFIAPLFNRFTPLEDAELVERVVGLLEKHHFKAGSFYVMDGSKRSTHGNAYFTGFGVIKRIVFYDTLLEALSADEIVAVLAHELGHLKKRHIWQNLIGFGFLSLIVLFGLYGLTGSPVFFLALNVHWHTTPVTLVLFLQVLPFLLFPLTPLLSLLSRRNEYEADAFAATQVAAKDLISALVKLFGENASTLTPDPLYSAVYSSHPTAADRVTRLESLSS